MHRRHRGPGIADISVGLQCDRVAHVDQTGTAIEYPPGGSAGHTVVAVIDGEPAGRSGRRRHRAADRDISHMPGVANRQPAGSTQNIKFRLVQM